MTDKKQPEALRLAALIEKTGARGSLRDQAAAELRRQYAEIETLRTGYEAARLEIESLKAQQPGSAYAALPEPQASHLKSCPCGATPGALHISGEVKAKWAYVSGSCCGEWSIEYRNNYAELSSPEAMELATTAWNEAPRASHGQAPAQPAPAAVAGPSEFPHEQMDVMALARYKVMPSHESMLHRHVVVAGDGSQQLYIGREVECENMARKFAGAFLDGAFAFHSMLAAAPTTQQAPAVDLGALQAEIAGHEAANLHLSAMVDELRELLQDAKRAMTELHKAAIPDESAEGVPAIIPPDAFRAFVDAHAKLCSCLHQRGHNPVQDAQQPVAWQSRTRPTWGGDNRPWSPWEPCTKGQAEDCWKTPLLHEWAYEARALYAAPQPSPVAQGDALDAARLDWLTFNLSGKALRDIGVVWSEHGDARRAIDAARAAQEGK